MPEILKQCPKCRACYPRTPEYFHKNKAQSDGLHHYCKKCRAAPPRPPLDTSAKVCTRCKQEKPPTPEYFSKSSNARDGFQAWCKECESEHAATRKAERKETNKAYRTKNSEKLKQKDKEYRLTNKERYQEQRKDRYKANRQKIIEKARQDRVNRRNGKPKDNNRDSQSYYMRNRERILKRPSLERERQIVRAQRQRSRKLNFPATLTATQWKQAINYFKGCCAVCERPLLGLLHTVHCDHWIPLSDPNCPGAVAENMVPLCGGQDGCNQGKGNKPAAIWLESKFGKHKAAEILARINAYFEWVKTQPE